MKLNLKTKSLSSWLQPVERGRPLVIAGPCSAESEDQVLATAHLLAQTKKVSALRAGVWKPRTRPGEFEGIGKRALSWLKRAKEETGLLIATEVAKGKHVEEALAAGVDILWIGARSTANPFTVQEIADALKGFDIPVMVKNPVNPDLSLWVGALERVYGAGITKLAAVHRGFSSFGKTSFRNEPMWELVIQLKTLCPELPILNDPSHICGNREIIPYICQKALDMDMQGLIIESHINPEAALTDAKQQITPAALAKMVDRLIPRHMLLQDPSLSDQLDAYRSAIDIIDDEILQKVAERMAVVEKIASYKLTHDVTILQVNRWEEMIHKRSSFAKALNLDIAFINKFLELIHGESIRQQTAIMNAHAAEES